MCVCVHVRTRRGGVWATDEKRRDRDEKMDKCIVGCNRYQVRLEQHREVAERRGTTTTTYTYIITFIVSWLNPKSTSESSTCDMLRHYTFFGVNQFIFRVIGFKNIVVSLRPFFRSALDMKSERSSTAAVICTFCHTTKHFNGPRRSSLGRRTNFTTPPEIAIIYLSWRWGSLDAIYKYRSMGSGDTLAKLLCMLYGFGLKQMMGTN